MMRSPGRDDKTSNSQESEHVNIPVYIKCCYSEIFFYTHYYKKTVTVMKVNLTNLHYIIHCRKIKGKLTKQA